MCIAKGFGGDRKAPERSHDKPTMAICTAKGFVKPDEVRDRKAPERSQTETSLLLFSLLFKENIGSDFKGAFRSPP